MDFCMNGAQVVPTGAAKTQLEAMIAALGILDGAKVKFFSNDIVPTPGMALGDLTESAFAGYTETTAVWSAVYTLPDGGVAAVAPVPPKIATGVGLPETVYGWYVVDSTEAILLAVRRLAEPQIINAVGQPAQVNAEYAVPGPNGDVVPPV